MLCMVEGQKEDCLVQELRLKTLNVLICCNIRTEGALNCFLRPFVVTDALAHVMFLSRWSIVACVQKPVNSKKSQIIQRVVFKESRLEKQRYS